MGGDGGTTAKGRKFIVTVKKEKRQLDKVEKARIDWSYCHLSAEPLREPIVACFLGHLYNKEAVLGALLGGKMPDNLSHIRSLKDVFNVKLSRTDYENADAPLFCCPITQLETNGKYKFVALPKCGHVISQKAFTQVGQALKCPICATEFDEKDPVILNGSDEDIEQLRQRLPARRPIKTKGKKRGHADDPQASKADISKKSLTSVLGTSETMRNKTLHDVTTAHENQKRNNEVYASLFKKSKNE